MPVLDSPASPTEKVLGVGVNVLVWRGLAEALGFPKVLGAVIAAGAMTIAADASAAPKLRQFANVLSAPGAMTIHALREGQLTIVETEGEPDA